MKILYTFLLLLVVSSTAYCQNGPDDCPKVERGADWLDPAEGWVYPTDSSNPLKNCNTDLVRGRNGYYKSQCTAWANYRTGFRGAGNAGLWANALIDCENATGNNDNRDCWSLTPSVGTLMIWPGGIGHVAVVECMDRNSPAAWVKVSEYNWEDCSFTYRTVTDIGTKPYKYIYPKGKPVPLPSNCSAPPAVPSALVVPTKTDGSEVDITVRTQGGNCSGLFYILTRKIKDANGEQITRIRLDKVNEPYQDHLINLLPCSEISYSLEKYLQLIGNDVLIGTSAPRIAYNLTTPLNFIPTIRNGTLATVDFNWDATCREANTYYQLEYICGQPNGSFQENVWGTGRTIPLFVSTQYKCRIRAYNDGDVSAWSSYVSFTTKGDPTKIPMPAPPKITSSDQCNQKTISWLSIDPEFELTNQDDYLYELKVYRNGEVLTTYPPTTEYNQRFQASLDGIYGFTLKAITKDRVQTSVESSPSVDTINCIMEVPILSDVTTASCKGASFSWAFAPEVRPINIHKFQIFRKEVPEGTYDYLAEVPANVTTYTDFTVENNTQAFYKVAVKYSDFDALSPLSGYKGVFAKSPPQTPIHLKAVSVDKAITVSFVDDSDDETGFILERATSTPTYYATIKTFAASSGKGATITFNDLGAGSNTLYFYRVKAMIGTTCSTDIATAAVTHTYVMLAPDNLKATFIEDDEPTKNTVKLTWRGLSRPATKYEIFRKQSIQPNWFPTAFDTVEVSSGDGNFSWIDEHPGTDLYQYKVRARYDLGEAINVSAFVGPVAYTVTDKCVVGERPVTPNITSAIATYTDAVLEWTDNSMNENGFFLEYSIDNKAWNLFRNIRSYSATSSTIGNPFKEKLDLSNYINGRVFFRVRAYKNNSDGSKCFSAIPVGTPTAVHILRAPASIKASQSGIARTFNVQWDNNTFYESGYEVQFSNSPPADELWKPLVQTIPDAVSYPHKEISLNKEYYYRVRAITTKGGVMIASSPWTTLTTPVSLFIPAKPSTFQLVPVNPLLPYGQYVYTWTDNATNEDNHTVTSWLAHPTTDAYGLLKRAILASTAADKSGTGKRSSPTTAALAVGKYRFGLHASNSIGNSDTIYTNFTVYGVPDAPTLLTSTIECSPMGDRVKLNWQDNAKNAKTETGFRIYRRILTADPYVLVGTTSADITTFTDQGTQATPLIAGKTYFYIVKGYSEFVKNESLSSNAASAKFPTKQLPIVTNVTATSTACASLTIKWTPVVGVDGYRIRVTCNNETYVPYTTPTAVSSYIFTTTKTGYHSVTVEAKSGCNYGPESTPVVTSVNSSIPPPPTSVSITGGCKIASGSWVPVANTNYRIDAVLIANGVVAQYIIKDTPPIQPTFSMINLAPGNYTFNVYAYNCKGKSPIVSVPVKVLGVPTAPVQLKVTTQCNNATLSWPPVLYAEYYTIYRKQGADRDYTTLGKVYCNSIENIVSGPVNTPYTYAVDAGNSCGISPKSTPISTFVTCTNSVAKAAFLVDEANKEEDVLRVHPNPFTNSATLTYTVNSPGIVHLTIYNQLGLPLFTLVDHAYKEPGTYEALIDEKYLANGLYVCVYKVGNKFYTTKLVKH